MKKFIKGTLELDTDVQDLVEYENARKPAILSIFDWGDKHGVSIRVGLSDDGAYLCEYKVRARTVAMCRGYVSELRQLLKPHFPKVESIYQASGDIIC